MKNTEVVPFIKFAVICNFKGFVKLKCVDEKTKKLVLKLK